MADANIPVAPPPPRTFASFFQKPADVEMNRDSLIKQARKAPPPKKDEGKKLEVEKKDDQVQKIKSLKIAKPKPKLLLKGREEKPKSPELEVEILKENPLVIRCIEKQNLALEPSNGESENFPEETLAVHDSHPPEEETLASRNVDSRFPAIDLQPIIAISPRLKTVELGKAAVIGAISNRFSALQDMNEDDLNFVDDTDEVENIFTERIDTELPQLATVDALRNITSSPQPILGKSMDDSFYAIVQEDDEEKVYKEFACQRVKRMAQIFMLSGRIMVKSHKIWVFSKKEVNVTLLGGSDQALHLGVEHQSVGTRVCILAVYAKSTRGRQALWADLLTFRQQNLNTPWMVGGDYNVIRFFEEYSGISVQDHATMVDFNDLIEESSLTELLTLGEEFTWGGTRSSGWGGRRQQPFNTFLMHFDSKLSNWKNKFLSQGGRLVLIKNVLSAIPIHVFGAIEPPKSILNAIAQKSQKFLWEGVEGDGKRHWQAWNRLTFLVSENGVGLRNFKDVLKAFSFKRWWKVKHRQGIWAKFILSLSHAVRNKTSWRRLERVDSLATSYSKVSVKNDDRSFCYDQWSSLGRLWDIEGVLPPSPSITIRDFFFRKQYYLCKFRWRLSSNVLRELEAVEMSFVGEEDRFIWKPTSLGNFTIKSAYETLWLSGSSKTALGVIKKVLSSFVIWELWKARNKFLFEGIEVSVQSIIALVKEHLHNTMLVNALTAQNTHEKTLLQQHIPWVNFDIKSKRVLAVSWKQEKDFVLNTDG
ncbi:OLC1v1016704C1 [Oldenlandia corymbosa var. corymbosa]|uniref:OLC1v1016704C1 n=1 Tax=Oldenlandia corymbosa var. corymbosa TaxID=529605 RepID=A0AAV1E7S5_OLDCO|nr:OLC1v1016704C1 [Oldenlandia corymbosa var. corymbosa]